MALRKKYQFFRFCKNDKCGARFQPTGKDQKLCHKCRLKSKKEANHKNVIIRQIDMRRFNNKK